MFVGQYHTAVNTKVLNCCTHISNLSRICDSVAGGTFGGTLSLMGMQDCFWALFPAIVKLL